MSQTENALDYGEVKEVTFLERLLVQKRWTLSWTITLFCVVIAVALSFFHLYVAEFGTPEGRSFRTTHLTVMMVLALLINPLFRRSHFEPIDSPMKKLGFGIDLGLVLAVIFVHVWTMWDIDAFQLRLGSKEQGDLIVGTLCIALVLEATRRTVGLAMVCVTGFFIFHALYAHKFFGFFYGPPTRPAKYIDTMFMSTDGIFGLPLHVAATYIVLFIIFGGLLIRSGAGKFFIDLAVSLTGHRVGGPAKAATVASGFMGTVSGSAVANVVTTGSFTIPLMKKLGYRPKFAAAVEACASSGGQITPPIMGAAAFIIAENLALPYVYVILAAVIPAFLYFATIYFMVHFEAEKTGIERISKDRLPRALEVLKDGWHLLFALGVLIFFLVTGYTPMKSAFWGILALVGLSFIRPATRMSPADILAAFESGIRSTVPVTVACACAGIIIGSVFVSGLGLKFTQSVIDMSGGNLLILLSLTAIAAIVLGMGMTTTAVYITVSALIVPSLEKLDVLPMAAHLFAFYFGVVSTITPPVALAAFAGAAIAKTPPMATAVESARVGIAKYLVPFAFVYNPSLLFEGSVLWTVYSTVAAVAGLWLLSAALESWLYGPLKGLQRLAVFAAAVLALMPPTVDILGVPGVILSLGGLALGAAVALMRRRDPAPQFAGSKGGAHG
ncbi:MULTISPECIES: TRAP transporter permease [Thalassobaculum]|uniref:TRAP transporter, 4TM/12TM fusion protein n=1 Tax=Thalassobaculum litoreum DSM 18839 TaxID=1123362 RepID=A0A8G2BKY4_9PROT|nr:MULTISPECIES: TRAP transporter permease [Thalassobaculum]SDG31222.1 TRAP transporter, 4TM/12TM fusion protein [Thalassobaculum litoreum DSM 18839]